MIDGRHLLPDAHERHGFASPAPFWKIIEPLRIIKLEFLFVKVEA